MQCGDTKHRARKKCDSVHPTYTMCVCEFGLFAFEPNKLYQSLFESSFSTFFIEEKNARNPDGSQPLVSHIAHVFSFISLLPWYIAEEIE